MQFGAYLSGVGECSDPNLLAELAHEVGRPDRAAESAGSRGKCGFVACGSAGLLSAHPFDRLMICPGYQTH